jgi:Ca-activated chloride channel family protein
MKNRNDNKIVTIAAVLLLCLLIYNKMINEVGDDVNIETSEVKTKEGTNNNENIVSSALGNRNVSEKTIERNDGKEISSTDDKFSVTDKIFSINQGKKMQENIHGYTTYNTNDHPIFNLGVNYSDDSYNDARKLLLRGITPDEESISIAGFLNYFDYEEVIDDEKGDFVFDYKMYQAPWNIENTLFHFFLKINNKNSAELDSNIVFLIDSSGSMKRHNKLQLFEEAMLSVLDRTKKTTKISVVTYAGDSEVLLSGEQAENKEKIIQAIKKVKTGEKADGSDVLEKAFNLAKENFVDGGINKIIVVTDKDFNFNFPDTEKLKKRLNDFKNRAVRLSILKFGDEKVNENMMKEIANAGGGSAKNVNNENEAIRSLFKEMNMNNNILFKEADFKFIFNPAVVLKYKFLDSKSQKGSVQKDQLFNIAEDFTYVGIFEVKLNDDVKISKVSDIGILNISYEENYTKNLKFFTKKITYNNENNYDSLDGDYRFSLAVAGFSKLLSGQNNKSQLPIRVILDLAEPAIGEDEFGLKYDFTELVKSSEYLVD